MKTFEDFIADAQLMVDSGMTKHEYARVDLCRPEQLMAVDRRFV